MTLVELCVQDLEGARIARGVGADRVEVCVDIAEGGLTPPFHLVEAALSLGFPAGVAVLIRPRAGGFVYSRDENALMGASIREYARLAGTGAPLSFVVGALDGRGGVQEEAIASFMEASGPHPLVFHRAFDSLADQERALEVLRGLGVARILTTGGHPTRANLEGLRRLVERAGEGMTILASGGLRSWNVAEAVARTGAREVHMRAPAAADRTDPVEAAAIMRALGR